MHVSLVLTYDCPLRCTYCPVKKETQHMAASVLADAVHAVRATSAVSEIRLAGAEPLCHVDGLKQLTVALPPTIPIRLTTNGIHLTKNRLLWLNEQPNLRLVLSLDGPPDVQAIDRKMSAGFTQNEAHLWDILDRESRQKTSVNMVISPQTVHQMVSSFSWIMKQGFRRINLLPAYYVRWHPAEQNALENGFRKLAALIDRLWQRGKTLTLVNMEQENPNPLFLETAMIDVDGYLYNSDVVTTRFFRTDRSSFSCGHVRDFTQTGFPDALSGPDWSQILEERIGIDRMESTHFVDEQLSLLVNRLRAI